LQLQTFQIRKADTPSANASVAFVPHQAMLATGPPPLAIEVGYDPKPIMLDVVNPTGLPGGFLAKVGHQHLTAAKPRTGR
jgi:hypothetical protein